MGAARLGGNQRFPPDTVDTLRRGPKNLGRGAFVFASTVCAVASRTRHRMMGGYGRRIRNRGAERPIHGFPANGVGVPPIWGC